MKNEDVDLRLERFFETAPRPAAPPALRSIASTLPERGVGRDGAPRLVRRLVGLAAAAVLLVGGLGLVALASGVRNGPAAVTLPPFSTAMPTGGPVGYRAGDFTWVRVGAQEFAGAEDVRVFHVEGGLLAIGTSRTAQATLWRSTDGFAWTPIDSAPFATDANLAPAPGASPVVSDHWAVVVYGIAKGPVGYLAVGGLRNRAIGTSKPAAWLSPDGYSWTRLNPSGLPDNSWLGSVAATSRGYVVSLAVQPVGDTAPPSGAEPVAFSADGVSWEISHDVDAGSVFAAFDRFFFTPTVAYNLAGPASSIDGRAWTPIAVEGKTQQLVSTPAGILSFAYVGPAQAGTEIWLCTDGEHWTKVGTSRQDGLSPQAFAYGRLFGFAWDEAMAEYALVSSGDGVDWQRHPVPWEVAAAPIQESLQEAGGLLFQVTRSEAGQPANRPIYDLNGPIEARVWLVRAARDGDTPGSTPPPTARPVTAPPSGLTEQGALDAALAAVPDADPLAVRDYGSASAGQAGQFGDTVPAVDPDRWVWRVAVLVLHPGCTAWAPPQVSPGSACWKALDQVVVYVDYQTGAVLAVLR